MNLSTKVVNRRTHIPTPRDVYIGRPSPWGNPFVIGRDGDRDAVCDKFVQWFNSSTSPQAIWMREHIHELHGKTLVCFCTPERCHGDFLARTADRRTPP